MINRGNYQSDVFATAGATKSFERALGQACERHGWRVHAYVLMRNHYHLALETTEPNLADGMQWLQGTFAARINRYRSKQGHLFQGRYKALLVEDPAALLRVANYVHLNPVRARMVPPAEVATYRWSSLHEFVNSRRPSWLIAAQLLAQLGLTECATGWERYIEYLQELATDLAEQANEDFDTMSHGWSIGTTGWRQALARGFSHLVVDANLAPEEARELKESRCRDEFNRALTDAGKTQVHIACDPRGSRWKIEVAARLRRSVAASYRWIAAELKMGTPLSVRVNVCRLGNR